MGLCCNIYRQDVPQTSWCILQNGATFQSHFALYFYKPFKPVCRLAWCLPCGFRHVVPYYYAVYFGALLGARYHPIKRTQRMLAVLVNGITEVA